jgi:hypothetical protein
VNFPHGFRLGRCHGVVLLRSEFPTREFFVRLLTRPEIHRSGKPPGCPTASATEGFSVPRLRTREKTGGPFSWPRNACFVTSRPVAMLHRPNAHATISGNSPRHRRQRRRVGGRSRRKRRPFPALRRQTAPGTGRKVRTDRNEYATGASSSLRRLRKRDFPKLRKMISPSSSLFSLLQ